MNIDTSEIGTLILIIIMAVVTILMRWGGIFVMSYIPINHRVQQFITAMSASVLVAIIAPMFIKGDSGAQVALMATAMSMLVLKRPLVSITLGILGAALIRNI